MARTKVQEKKSTLLSIDEVNEALRKIAELNSSINKKVSAYNEAEAKRRESLDNEVNPMRETILEIEENLKLYAEEKRDELFEKKKTLELSNGSIGFRLGMPKLVTLKGFKWDGVLAMIKRSKQAAAWIRTKEEINKEQIIMEFVNNEVDSAKLQRLGCEVVQTETFGYEAKTAVETETV